MRMNAQTIQVSLEPTMNLVIRSPYDESLSDIFSKVPQCSYKPAQRGWVIGVGRLEPDVGLGVYDCIVNQVKPACEQKGYTVKFNQQMLIHARTLADIRRTSDQDFAFRLSPNWQNSLSDMGVTPYQHQLDAVRHWLDGKGRGVFGHEMGTGKTISSILACHALYPKGILIFVPASLKAQWKSEVTALLPDYGVVEYDGKNYPEEIETSIVLVSYAMADKVASQIDRYGNGPEIVIADECHYIKNPKAARTKAVVKLAKKVPFFLGLSGTPIINRPVDLYPVLNLTAPYKFHDWYRFTKKFCNGHEGKFGYVCDGLTNAQELHQELSNVMHRVRKADCLDLPSKTRSVIPVDFFNQKGWVADYYDLREKIQEGEAHFAQLRKFIGQSKATQSVDWIVDFLESTDQKLVVFCHHVELVKLITAEVNRRGKAKSDVKPLAVSFTGETPAEERNKAISKFQDTKARFPCRVLVTTVGAGGTGLNLQVANQMLIVESTYSPGEMLQAEDRIHRSGQTTPVTIHYIIAQGTYDRVLYNLLTQKMAMMNKVVDGDFSKDLNVYEELMREI